MWQPISQTVQNTSEHLQSLLAYQLSTVSTVYPLESINQCYQDQFSPNM